MGSVWRARHRTLGRHFAIKFLKTAVLGGETLEQRFLREARLAASVQHRYVVDIVDYGLTDEPVPYMVMEFLEGESLYRRCQRVPPLTVRALVRICADALLGLESVHQAGIVHRDLKPENIMLVREADAIIPKLVDFGISLAEVDDPENQKRLTQPGAFVGTPWYMSPELVRRQAFDRRSDIYSIGVILYEALLREPPYDHADLPALLELVKRGGALPLVERCPALGPGLSAVVEQAMAIEPAARFSSAAEMAARLVEIIPQIPEELACPDPPAVSRRDTEVIERAPIRRARTWETGTTPRVRWWKNPRLERAVAVAGAAVVLALLLWETGHARLRADQAPRAAVEPAALAVPLEPSASASESPTPIAAAAAPTITAITVSDVVPLSPAEQARRPSRRAPRPDHALDARRLPAGVVGDEPLVPVAAEEPPAPVQPPEHHRPRPARVAAPDVFRTPGF
jgi:hypothetical protein